jgi:hypothetical protein
MGIIDIFKAIASKPESQIEKDSTLDEFIHRIREDDPGYVYDPKIDKKAIVEDWARDSNKGVTADTLGTIEIVKRTPAPTQKR